MTTGITDKQLAEAARWQLRLAEADDDAQTHKAFSDWIEADAANHAAFQAIGSGHDAFDDLSRSGELEQRVQEARQVRKQRRNKTIASVVVLAITGLAGAAYVTGQFGPSSGHADAPLYTATLSSERAQMRDIALPDGSNVTLSGGTTLEVNYIEGERDLRLISGQARFQVSHDDSRPFEVSAGDGVVVATGTDFSVLNLQGYSAVTLISGRVHMERQCAPSQTGCDTRQIDLRPGDRLDWRQGESDIRRSTSGAEEALAWLSGRLVADDTPLGLVAETMNRNASEPVVLSVSASAADMRISGVFNLDKPDHFVKALQELLPVEVTETSDGYSIMAAPGEG